MNNTTRKRILVAEDHPDFGDCLGAALGAEYTVDCVASGDQAVSMIRQDAMSYTAVLLNLRRVQAVWETLRQVRIIARTLPALVVVDAYSEMSEAGCAKLGYTKMVWKPVPVENLCRALDEHVRANEEEPGEGRVSRTESASGSWWAKTQSHIHYIGASDVTVLVQGETGSGKEVVARQLHACSARAKKAFLKVNCAALPSELIESELFGYERGAFTGAFKNNPGKFELADGGTIFLDEIGDMDFKLQAKLLQVLQDREFLRLGASEPCRVDVRVIAATHCDLERMMDEGKFREDLYYRLNIITIRVPPLRERKDEIVDLAHYFLQKHATATEPAFDISQPLHDALLSHDWPGNVRELENVMRKLLVLRRSDLVIDDLSNRARRRKPQVETAAPPVAARTVHVWANEDDSREIPDRGLAEVASLQPQRWEVRTAAPIEIEHGNRHSILEKVDEARREAEMGAILNALNTTLWNRKRAAELLKIDYKALLYKMKKLGIVERASRIAI